MEIPVELVIVEFDRDGVVAILVYCPYKSDKIQAEIFSIAAPGCRARLKGFMVLNFNVATFSKGLPKYTVTIM
ncbi:hypothetical protein RRF57_010807 [Xylaria bambusicola]|uniref:Uncharacterized protein n=1 Tax=Xylaria bambusicola TaxID=326684 RepID=A0AAN7UYM8_9PEZI